jgi:zinc protease
VIIERLPGGLTAIVLETRAAPVVALQIWANVGSLRETPAEAGIAHFLEHMIFKGSERLGAGELAAEVEAAGGDVNAWTSFHSTVFHVVIASRYWELGLAALLDAVPRPRLEAAEIDRERQVILEEIRQGRDSPMRVVSEQLFRQAYRRHPYRNPVIGRRATVASFQREDLLAFHRRWYGPSNLTLVVVGDVDAAAVLAAARAQGPTRGARAAALPDFAEPAPREPRAAVTGGQVQDAYLAIAFHVPGLAHEDVPCVDLGAALLGQGDSSRLHRRVLREAQLVTEVSAYAYTPPDRGLLTLQAYGPADRLEAAAEAILVEALALGQSPASVEELGKAQRLIESEAIFQGETVQGLARKVGYFHQSVGDPDYERGYLRRVAALSPREVRTALARYLRPEVASVSVVLPDGAARGGEAALRRRLAALPRAVAARLCPAAPARARRPAADGVIRSVLPGGLRLLVKPDATVPLVAFRAVWLGGLRYERPDTSGINHLIAALLTRGTATRTGDEIVAAVESMSGAIGGFAGRNSLGVRLETLGRYGLESFAILADCLRNAAFADAEFERERELVRQEILGRDDVPSAVAFRRFGQLLYQRHPYRREITGELETIARLTPDRLRRYHARHAAPAGLVITAVGDVDPGALHAEALRLLSGGPRLARAPAPDPEPRRTRPARRVEPLPKEQAQVIVGHLGTTLGSPDRFALEVLCAVLSGQGGRLFVHLRDAAGLCYRIGAYSLEGLDPGYVAIYGATAPARVPELLAGIRAELDQVRREPVPAAELDRARRYLAGNHDLALQQRSALAAAIAFNELYGLGHDAHRHYARHLEAVTAAEVQRVARTYLAPGSEVEVVLTPEPERVRLP